MMNKRIRSLIDDLFADMKMTAENLALRDELMANAQARYEDAVAQGRSEEEAFADVAASLGDVRSLLENTDGGAPQADGDGKPEGEPEAETAQKADAAAETGDEAAAGEQTEAPAQADAGTDAQAGDAPDGAQDAQTEKAPGEGGNAFDLGDALNSVFSALGDFGRSVMPQAKKLVRDVDNATGGMVKDVGRAVNRGMRDAQKAAGEAIDRMNRRDAQTVQSPETPAEQPAQSAQELRETAKDLRAQAALKRVTGDEENAAALESQAEAMETQADAIEQAEAMEQAGRDAQQQADDAAQADEQAQRPPLCGEDGEIDEGTFADAVEDLARDAERLADEAVSRVKGCAKNIAGGEPVENMRLTQHFPVAGLRGVDVKLDADDVTVEPGDGLELEVCWEAEKALTVPDVRMDGHTLVVRRANPDVFKTFFSVFKKDGGRITVRVPRGYASDFTVSTTSGNIALRDVDVANLHVSTTSGTVRLEPDASVRAEKVEVSSVSGAVTVSACTQELEISGVSGEQFISCDAGKADVNTVSGRVHAEGACDEWEVSSVSGSVEIVCTVVPTRKIKLDTVSAGARVWLPGDVRGFAASVSGMNGSIVNDFGPERYGTCALPIHMDTISGQLAITRL